MKPGIGASGRSSDRMGHLLRDLTSRVRNLEDKFASSQPSWKLTLDENGSLVAQNTSTGAKVTLAPTGPEQTGEDSDA